MRNPTKLGILLAVTSVCVTCSQSSGSGSESNFLCKTDSDCPRGACINGICDPEAVPAATPLQLGDASVVEADSQGIPSDGSAALADGLMSSPDATTQSDGAFSACWAAHGSACNPLTNEPCRGELGEVCQLTDTGLACNQVGAGSPWRGDGCSVFRGTPCGPGLHCVLGDYGETCREFCCTHSDCSDIGSTCQPLSGTASLGTCTLPAGHFLGSVCGVRDPFPCTPFGDMSRCEEPGTSCQLAAVDGGTTLACLPWYSVVGEAQPCGPASSGEVCETGTYCSPTTNVCRRSCCNNSFCFSGQTCHALAPADLGSFGYCE
jgi:hypothetical protein